MEKCLHCGAEVEFEIDATDELCPECGWSKKASIKLSPSQRNGKALKIKPRPLLAKATGIFLIILGIISIGNPIAFMLDLWAGISILRMKEKGRHTATGIQIIQLSIGSIGIVVYAIFAFQYKAFQYKVVLERFIYYLITIPIALLIHGIVLIILTRPSVRLAFSRELP